MTTDSNSATRVILALCVLLIVAFGAAYALTNGRDTRTTGDKVGDAINGLESKGVGEATDRLGHQSPAQRIGNAVEDSDNK